MKKILIIGMTPNRAGVETYVFNMFSKMKDDQIKFEFLNIYDKPLAYSKYIEKNGGNIKQINVDKNPIHYFKRFSTAKEFFKNNNDYYAVYLNTSTINMIYWLKAANDYGIKRLIIHSHDNKSTHNSFIINIAANIIGTYNRFFLRNKNVVELAVSNESGKWMFKNNDFRVIRNGIDTKLYLHDSSKRNLLKHKIGISQQSKVIMTVARLEEQKNYFRILKIFNIVHQIDSSIYLVIVGNGSQKNILMDFVEKLGIRNYVIFLGEIKNVSDVLNIADIMLMPSIHEGFPFSLIEGQAAGVPALVSSEAVPYESNITHTLQYLSLKEDNNKWVKSLYSMLNNSYNKERMNQMIQDSPYTIRNLKNQIIDVLK